MARTTVIKDKFAAWLARVPAVAANAPQRVYPLGRVPQGVTRPYLTFKQVGSDRQTTLSGPTTRLMQAFIEVDVYGGPLIASQIADAVRQAIDGDLPRTWLGTDGSASGVYDASVSPAWVQAARVLGDRDKDDPPQQGDEKPDTAVCLDSELWFEEG